jgi:ankyrin repeat protein
MSYTIGNQVYRHNFIQVYCIYVCIFNLQGKTTLHVAVSNNDTRIVELLMEKGADPNNRDDDISTKYIWS